MSLTPYLIFSLHDSLYGVQATLVQEIFYLPEVTIAVEAPPEIVPIMDLDRRLGKQPQDYQLSNSIIVVEWQNLLIGILVNQVHEVKNLDSANIEMAIQYGREQEAASKFTAGLAKSDSEIITILNPEILVCYSSLNETLATSEVIADEVNDSNQSDDLFSHLTVAEKAVLQDRATNLRQLPQSQELTDLIPLAVIGLNGEYFGLDLKFVREFIDVRKITPIPCCPSHIIGNMNLRGEIVTLIDIHSLLNLSVVPDDSVKRAMIVNIDELIAGIKVDEVFDVTYLHLSNLKVVPAAMDSEASNFLKGTAFYGGKVMGIINMQKILQQGKLFVEEEV
jgi:purine-binding chemotaxis protein CheW